MHIGVIPNACDGCEICELICSKQDGRFNTKRTKIRVTSELYKIPAVNVCRQCEDPACVASCPVDAFKEISPGVYAIDEGTCTQCLACVDACPYGSIFIWREKVLKCDLCGGSPRCTVYCPKHVLELVK